MLNDIRKHPYFSTFLAIILALTLLGLQGCASVEKTLGAIDYGCVDIDVNPHTSDSGLMGRGIVLSDGEELTPETVELLCNY